MNDDPVSVLNLQAEPAPGSGNPGKWWVASILSLVGFFGGGILLAFSVPQGSGSLGLFALQAGGGLLVGAFLCVVFATMSISRGESGSLWALITAMPCALMFAWMFASFVGGQLEQREREDSARQREAYVQQLRSDPEMGLREHWAGKTGSTQLLVFANSLQDSGVHYSLNQLQRIYDEAPQLRARVLANSACTPEFLAAHLPDAAAEPGRYYYSSTMLQAIVENPHTPVELLESIAHSTELPAGAAKAAGDLLDHRKPLSPADRFESFRRYEVGAEKKYFGLNLQGPAFRLNSQGRKIMLPVNITARVPGGLYSEIKTDSAKVVMLPGVYSMDTGDEWRNYELAQAFAIEHNAKVARQARER